MVVKKVDDSPDAKGYAWLAGQLRQAILTGEIPAGESLPATKHLGKQFGTSPETARRAAKQLQSEGLVSSEPRQGFRVLARVNDPDRGLPIAFVVADAEHPGLWDEFYRLLFAGLQNAAAERQWPMLAVGAVGRSGRQIMEQLRDCRACGMVLDSMNADLVAAVTKMGMPAVMMDAWEPEMRLDAVVQDSFQGTLLAARHLIGRGHKRIGWLGRISESVQGQERFGGVCAALAAAGLKASPELMQDTPPEKTAEGARKLLDRRDRPTAVIGPWHDAAAELAKAAAERGLTPGKDLEIVGWSAEEQYDSSYRKLFGNLPLPATMVWSIADLARAAIARLAERRLKLGLVPAQVKIPAKLKRPEREDIRS
ncbi:MAG: GntR family transcriptional regulator [Planctomycetes bacterium]|nr:GntR family transcriptional regulator [Planctomycetota bacterium]